MVPLGIDTVNTAQNIRFKTSLVNLWSQFRHFFTEHMWWLRWVEWWPATLGHWRRASGNFWWVWRCCARWYQGAATRVTSEFTNTAVSGRSGIGNTGDVVTTRSCGWCALGQLTTVRGGKRGKFSHVGGTQVRSMQDQSDMAAKRQNPHFCRTFRAENG